ncbi:MAG TPA: DUF1289 domain-containing protein [Novimethylophilus sp.]|uniref:DUF1289 domain-containing protein n=1 Tax=Novimethylophilus sp. TaxID=2137426 RepID=UPI002F40D482
MPTILSPCNGICRINVRSGMCESCFRTSEEIKAWPSMSDERRHQLLQVLEQRQMEMARFD